MTYQNLGYWVAEANDSSTGNHPTGWTIYQRWSETASEWATMYNTEYANARDNSAGQPNKPSGTAHPTGWTSGQFWSATATQWNTMWGTEWTNARDTSTGQTGRPSGLQHPTGWVSAQLWSATATQWNTMWATEWSNSHDPQGYAYSYPGQAANAVYWSQSASYWKGQADYYWGPNRIWNNGSTWEQLYNLYVGYYNDMVNQRDTWTARANSAWGPNRVWNNGESWEAAYYRVLPAGSGQTPNMYVAGAGGLGLTNQYQNLSFGPSVNSSNWGSGTVLYCPVTGFYTISYLLNTPSVNDNSQVVMRLLINGGDVANTNGTVEVGNFSNKGQVGILWYSALGVGTSLQIQILCWQNPTFGVGGGTLIITFVPTQWYPH